MDRSEFIKRITDSKRSLEYADENSVYNELRTLTNLINSVKDEKYFKPEWHKSIMDEINDMDKSEYEVKRGMKKKEIDNRLGTMSRRIGVELNHIIFSREI